MYKANLKYTNKNCGEYTRTVEHDDQRTFFAILVGNIEGNILSGSSLIEMNVLDPWMADSLTS